MSQSRQLAAIMFTDIVGYTSLMGKDENKAFALLEKNRQLQKPIIESFDGRWIKEMGDGVIASFNTASDALAAAIKIQEACHASKDFQLRIGIHQGEVVFENDDVFGDTVNIASRIESLGIAGAVLISKAIRDQVKNKTDFQLESLGHFDFKNVSEPMEVFALANPGFAVPKREEMQGKLKLPQKKSNAIKWIIAIAIIAAASISLWYIKGQKETSDETRDQSIAVLPFVNMSDDKDQEYFSDGISEEIINKLAQAPGLFVIGRTTSFAFKGKNMDLKLIGEQLNASYILEGSVRRSGNILRITAQLINVANGYHLYSQTFDKELKDVFAIQDEISLDILSAIKIKLFGAEKDVVLKKYTDNVEAYQLYLKGSYHYNKFTPDGFIKAIEYFKAAIAIDPDYAIAYTAMSFCYMNLGHFNWLAPDKTVPLGIEAANKALELDDEIAESHLAVGRIMFHHEYKVREAEVEFKKAIAINPNSAEVHVQLGFCAAFLGNNKEATEHAIKAESLDPFSPLNLAYIGFIYSNANDPEKLLALGKRLIDLEPNFPPGHVHVGFSYMLSKRYEEAIPEFEMAVKLYPDLGNLGSLGIVYGLTGQEVKAREIIEQLKKIAGSDVMGNAPIGYVYASIGEWDAAFRYFDKAIENHDFRMTSIKVACRIAQMDMKDPRVLRLLEKMGQPYE